VRRAALFGDAFYWIALTNPHDNDHARVASFAAGLGDHRIVTTEEVLAEVLATFSAQGAARRRTAVVATHRILASASVDVVPQSHDSFLAGLALYEARPDKEYSLVDCISMHVMRARGLFEALTHDHHFEQEGFVRLFP
jgi:uncharacterized protein